MTEQKHPYACDPDETQSALIEANELINEIESLKEERGDLLLQVNAYNTLMPCGHLARYVVTADEGTQYCLMCLTESMQETDGE